MRPSRFLLPTATNCSKPPLGTILGTITARISQVGRAENFGDSRSLSNCPQQISAFPQQCPKMQPLCLRGLGISPVLCNALPYALDTRHRLRSRAESAVEPASTICHRRALARRPTPVLSTTALHLIQVSWRVAVLQPPAPPFMGCSFDFLNATHRVSPQTPYCLSSPCLFYKANDCYVGRKDHARKQDTSEEPRTDSSVPKQSCRP